jgi:hypothetical protein
MSCARLLDLRVGLHVVHRGHGPQLPGALLVDVVHRFGIVPHHPGELVPLLALL